MNELVFDKSGFLQPAQAIVTELETVRRTFAYNPHRAEIFGQYLAMLDAVQAIISPHTIVAQWLDGSFVTKTVYPNDLDGVFFIDESVYRNHRPFLESILRRFTKIDAYFVSVFPTDHPQRFVYDYSQMYWRDVFGHTRDGERKGFIQLDENHGLA